MVYPKVAFLPPNQRAGGTGTITVRPYSHASRVLFDAGRPYPYPYPYPYP